MAEFLLLHDAELLGVVGLEVEGVEAEVTRVVGRAKALERRVLTREGGDRSAEVGALRGNLAVERVGPAGLDAEDLAEGDAEGHGEPDADGKVRDLLDRRAAVTGEERVELLLHEEASGSEHADTAVGELGLTEAVALEGVLALGEAGGVEEAERRDRAGEPVALRRLHDDARARRRQHGDGREGERVDGESEHSVCGERRWGPGRVGSAEGVRAQGRAREGGCGRACEWACVAWKRFSIL